MTHQIENMKQHKVIISGGGSGGHIFPAIAIAKSLLELDKNIDFLVVKPVKYTLEYMELSHFRNIQI